MPENSIASAATAHGCAPDCHHPPPASKEEQARLRRERLDLMLTAEEPKVIVLQASQPSEASVPHQANHQAK
ncbi:hypothetical protein QQS21_011594 [Conoideocrella luteorostrata]|uniref:Uncharacterized protein n=1 Tax=Conoideocrella luteorostrata TaxID=1105319 RepID=A0AAJ0CCU2_9HYPO|nr:hypothetical protein QQS21_011594 [Conoideocrella luteorostrata]